MILFEDEIYFYVFKLGEEVLLCDGFLTLLYIL